MKKVTYLIGAGASAGSMPVVQDIRLRISELIAYLKANINLLPNDGPYEYGNLSKQPSELIDEIFISLEWLYKESANHASIDTLAKKYFIKNCTAELYELKVSLSLFFIFEQLRKQVDKRYDSFFAALLTNESLLLPDNLRVVSWNYDSQFEMAFSQYSDDNNILPSDLKVSHKFFPKYNEIDCDRFGLFKLNGTTSLANKNGFKIHHFVSSFITGLNTKNFSTILKNFGSAKYLPAEISSILSFAWENENNEEGIIKKVKKATVDTEVLVLIGYSFPFFNRMVDREIIQNMATTLKKIYVQDLNPENILDSFSSLWPEDRSLPKIKLINSVDQFYLPPEL